MTKLGKQLMLALGVAVLGTGAAFADDSGGDSGDNGMSQWTGDSYAAFHGKLVGDFRTPRDKYAAKELEKTYPTAEPTTEVIASAAKRGGHPITRSRDEAGA
jgi:hypothetical protein